MPWYDYRCTACGAEFEIRRSMSEQSAGAPVACTGCGSERTERVFRPIAVGTAGSSRSEASEGASCGPACACHRN